MPPKNQRMYCCKTAALIFVFAALLTSSCKKEEDPEPAPAPVPVPCLSYTLLNFNKSAAYFATGDTLKAPLDSIAAKPLANKIDITFFFDSVYTEPGFMDPVTRSKDWTWNDYKTAWLKNAREIRYYSTAAGKSEFDAAKADTTALANVFASSDTKLAPHGIYPTGSCIGGRTSSNPTSLKITKEKVFAFKNLLTGKRGLIYIRGDQPPGWPLPVGGTTTRVDIIREP